HATTFLFNREDHTLGNLLVTQLRKNPAVEYVAYKVAHPMHYSFELRVHITPGSMAAGGKRRLEAKDAVVEACKELVADLGMLGKRITQEWYIYKVLPPLPVSGWKM
ncbi:RBP11-like subunits of RNA polymerase, partial [Wilcoxina mikolae CBS 423.85]